MVMPTTASGTLVEEEVIRGGDGVLTLLHLAIDGVRIDPGLTVRSGKPKPPQPGPDARLPRFRVRGKNPAPKKGGPVDALIDALVEDFYERRRADPWIGCLGRGTRQVTARLAVGHESARCQFIDNDKTAGRFTHGVQVFGKERHMPTFGGPHGYGLGQIDHPPTDPEIVWHFVKNLKESIRILMEVKGSQALRVLRRSRRDDAWAPTDQREKAVFRREVVRGYNAGREFVWDDAQHDWFIVPSGTNNIEYPSIVLETRTQVIYRGIGQRVTFSTKAYGPGL
jgi:hypothetical protein